MPFTCIFFNVYLKLLKKCIKHKKNYESNF